MLKDIKELQDFQKFDIVVGTIVDASTNIKAKNPAYILKIDFGLDYGIKVSSAQITENYELEDLKGKQIIAVLNFPVKRIAGVKSECLVLAALSEKNGTTLLSIDSRVPNGSVIA